RAVGRRFGRRVAGLGGGQRPGLAERLEQGPAHGMGQRANGLRVGQVQPAPAVTRIVVGRVFGTHVSKNYSRKGSFDKDTKELFRDTAALAPAGRLTYLLRSRPAGPPNCLGRPPADPDNGPGRMADDNSGN